MSNLMIAAVFMQCGSNVLNKWKRQVEPDLSTKFGSAFARSSCFTQYTFND